MLGKDAARVAPHQRTTHGRATFRATAALRGGAATTALARRCNRLPGVTHPRPQVTPLREHAVVRTGRREASGEGGGVVHLRARRLAQRRRALEVHGGLRGVGGGEEEVQPAHLCVMKPLARTVEADDGAADEADSLMDAVGGV